MTGWNIQNVIAKRDRIPQSKATPIVKSLQDPFNTRYCFVSIVWAMVALHDTAATSEAFRCYDIMLSFMCTPFSTSQLFKLEKHWNRLDCDCVDLDQGFSEFHTGKDHPTTSAIRRNFNHALTQIAMRLREGVAASYEPMGKTSQSARRRMAKFVGDHTANIHQAFRIWFDVMDASAVGLFGRIMLLAPQVCIDAIIRDAVFRTALADILHRYAAAMFRQFDPANIQKNSSNQLPRTAFTEGLTAVTDTASTLAYIIQQYISDETFTLYFTPTANVLYAAFSRLLEMMGTITPPTHQERTEDMWLRILARVTRRLHGLSTLANRPIPPIVQQFIDIRPLNYTNMPGELWEDRQTTAILVIGYLNTTFNTSECFQHLYRDRNVNITTPTKQCSQCRAVRYCSKECQKAAWKRHKPLCGIMKRLLEAYKLAGVRTPSVLDDTFDFLTQLTTKAELSDAEISMVIAEAWWGARSLCPPELGFVINSL